MPAGSRSASHSTVAIARAARSFRFGPPRAEPWFPDMTGLIGQYAQGDEPSFHIPYLYNYAGGPWKTQRQGAGKVWYNAWASAATMITERCRHGMC
jgi:Glycosyl hydrolase family 92